MDGFSKGEHGSSGFGQKEKQQRWIRGVVLNRGRATPTPPPPRGLWPYLERDAIGIEWGEAGDAVNILQGTAQPPPQRFIQPKCQ